MRTSRQPSPVSRCGNRGITATSGRAAAGDTAAAAPVEEAPSMDTTGITLPVAVAEGTVMIWYSMFYLRPARRTRVGRSPLPPTVSSG